MANRGFVPSSDSPNIQRVEYVADASVTFNKGALLYRSVADAEVKEATSSAGTIVNIECVSAETVTTAATNPRVDAYPITGPGQYWVVDCNANTADNQLNKGHILTSATTINNTSTANQTSAGVFIALRAVGAAANKKLFGYFVKIGQEPAK